MMIASEKSPLINSEAETAKLTKAKETPSSIQILQTELEELESEKQREEALSSTNDDRSTELKRKNDEQSASELKTGLKIKARKSYFMLASWQILCSCTLIAILFFHMMPNDLLCISNGLAISPKALMCDQTALTQHPISSLQGEISNRLLRQKLHVHIESHGYRLRCGGCMVLEELYETLISFNISTSKYIVESSYFANRKGSQMCAEMQIVADNATALNKTLVIVLPEGSILGCSLDHERIVVVHWILAPVGKASIGNWAVLQNWGRNDLVFNYASSCSPLQNVPTSSILQVIAENPEFTYDTLPLQEYNRSGVLAVERKGKQWHDDLVPVSEIFPGMESRYLEGRSELSLKDFLDIEYFLSYDPYTYYTYAAAIAGAISIVQPLKNVTKKEWLLGTYVGEYARNVGAENVPGVAWGWDEDEIRYARETMGELRSFMDQTRNWGKQVTVWRFLRDAYRHGEQDFDHFEGGMTVEDVYYWLLDLSEEARMAKEFPLKWCSSKKLKICECRTEEQKSASPCNSSLAQ